VEAKVASARDVTLLSAAVILGALIAPQLSAIGLPILAAGIAGLVYRGHSAAAAFAAAFGVAAVAAVQLTDAIYAGPAVLAVLAAVLLLPRRSAQVAGALLVGVLTLAGAASDAVLARTQGTTLTASIAKQTALLADEFGKALGASASVELVARIREAAVTMASAWPSSYFEGAVLVTVLAIAAIAWAARRADRTVNVPALGRLDLSPHVLWAFVAGVLLVAASYGSFAASKAFGVVGLNLVLCARTLFFLQGISVSAGVLDRTGVGLGGRILALAALAALDALTLVVSLIGLLDFWVNFRRLPRDGVTPDAPAEDAGL
jgi:hypothetical protein